MRHEMIGQGEDVGEGFAEDRFPGRPRILFVGFGESSHTRAWVDLLRDARFNVRLFDLPTSSLPPSGWWVPCYVTAVPPRAVDRAGRRFLYPPGRLGWLARRIRGRLVGGADVVVGSWLRRVVREWRPDIVHTLGLDPAGFLYQDVRDDLGVAPAPIWVLQLRGGSDLELVRHDPEASPRIGRVLAAADRILSDNLANVAYVRALGVDERRFPSLVPVPGTGGVDVDALHAAASVPPAERRTVMWPKAYESAWSKGLPVIEALRCAWPRIAPCEVRALAASDEILAWVRALPPGLCEAVTVEGRVPHQRSLELMCRARVMLAPSLVDGTPNTMFEAMACGALPVVSPLETIRAVVREDENVLFARNLYPDEIARTLVRAMTDDGLVRRCADANLRLVREVADRSRIGPRVVALYEQLAAARAEAPPGRGTDG